MGMREAENIAWEDKEMLHRKRGNTGAESHSANKHLYLHLFHHRAYMKTSEAE